MGNVTESDFEGGAASFALRDAIVLVTFGEMKFVDASATIIRFDQPGVVRVGGGELVRERSAHGGWLLLLTPFVVDGRPGNEAATRLRVSELAGLFAVFCGRNAVFEHVFDNEVRAHGQGTTVSSPVAENPGVFPRPDLGRKRYDLLMKATAAIDRAPNALRNRITLSLHWYHLALRSSGIDAFLKAWIALEILAMPDGTNIRRINESLSRAYGEPLEEATRKYSVGKLFNLRSRIVHNGELVSVHYLIEAYVQAIFSDVLCETLQVPTQGDTDALLTARGSELQPLLQL